MRAVVIVGVVVLLALAVVGLFLWRLRAIAGRVGSFPCYLGQGTRWLSGVAVYTRDALVWYEVLSISRRPRHSWDRDLLAIVGRDASGGSPPADVVAHCTLAGRAFAIAAQPAALDGLVSWLEAAPPGARSREVI